MAVASLDPLGAAIRFVGIMIFVFLATPFGPFQSWIAPENPSLPSIPMILCIILVLSMHIYLLYRAYYALHLTGILVLAVFYALLAYHVASLFGVSPISVGSIRWHSFFFLTMLYSYGVFYSFVDSYISGLLHTKNV